MSDPNEGQETLVKQEIEPEKTEDKEEKNAPEENVQKKEEQGEKKLERNQSDVRSSINHSQSEESFKNKVDLTDSIVGEQQVKQEQVEEKKIIPEDYFYSEEDMREFDVPSDSPVSEAVAKLDYLYGHDSFKNYNALILDRDTVIYSSGISYTIFNHFTKEKKVFYSRDKGGIGSIAVHPKKKHFAVAEKGTSPNIYIYEFPSLKLYRVLRKGTQKSYSCINFSGNGDMLASVGSNPDYLLTVWEWKQEQVLLKSKAFSQQVYNVNFSQFNEKWITTSGTGHIRFWRIASTFTGMKLKGDIAKFGQFQLSDVASFAQFEDANVVSSSEYGKLLLWEGNLIKSVISIDENTPCHNGSIQFVKLVGDKVVTAGSDGYIRFWDYITMNQGQSDEQFNFYMKPQKQIKFDNAHLLWIDMAEDFWIVQDARGALWRYQLSTGTKNQILKFNSGKYNDFALSPLNNAIITTGYDGCVRLWDYGSKRQFYSRSFPTNSQSTSIEWLPFSKKNAGRMIVVGFSDGIVRFLFLESKQFTLVKAFKVHKNAISKIKANRQGTIIAVSDTSGSIFFISLDSPIVSKITPYCLFETGFKINDLSWDRNGEKLLVACNDGRLHQINILKEKDCDFTESYLKDFEYRTYVIKMMESQKPNRQQLELELLLKKTKGVDVDETILDEEWQPSPILNAVYYDNDCTKILCSVDGKFLGNYYIVDFAKERPVGAIEASKTKTSYLGILESQNLIYVGMRNGTWQIRNKLNPNNYLKKKCFDQDYGIVKKIAMNLENSALLSASEDGTMLCYKFDYETFKKGVRGDLIDEVQISIPNVILGITETTFSDKIELGKQTEIDVQDGSIYCLQDQKLKAEEDMKLSEAEKIKLKKRKKIKELQKEFEDVVKQNNKQSDYLARLNEQQLLVDPQYAEQFQRKVDEEEEETKKVLMWDEYFGELAKKKLQSYYVDELQFKKFSVKGINTEDVVSSLKLKKLSPYVLKELESIQKIISIEDNLSKKDKKSRTNSSFTHSKAIMELNKQKQTKKGAKQENIEVKNKIRQAEAQFEKELAHAIATKGDYKLKCSPNYVVPENQRLNVSRKKKHLFLHYQYIFLQKKLFNERLNKLKEKKHQIIDQLPEINAKLKKINEELEQVEDQYVIQIDDDLEQVQIDIEVTEEDIQEHIIEKKRQKEASKKTGGMGMGGNQPKEQNKQEQKKIKKKPKKKVVQEQKQGPQIKVRQNLKVKKSPLDDEVRQIRKIVLSSEKEKIKSDLDAEVNSFDEELSNLKAIKYNLQNDFTMVEMKILTYAQEFIIFRDMETYDNELMEQLTSFGQDKERFQDHFIGLTSQINQLQGVVDDFKKKYEEEKKILKEFVYPEDEEMRERIIRYYKIRERKRIAKLKKQAQLQERQKQQQEKGQQDSDEEEDSDEESEEEESDDEFDEEQDEKPDITVIENDHKNFERVRKICQYDEKIEENSRRKSELEKERNQIHNKIKNLDNELDKAENKLKEYQKKKLLKINQLIVSYPLKLSQIQYIVKMQQKAKLQQDFGPAIIFTNEIFHKLSRRIEELKLEKVDIEKKQKNLNKKLSKLSESVNKASLEIESKRKDYQQKQLLKFGSTFELQKLKQLEPTTQVLETRQLYKKEQRQVSKKIQNIKQDLQGRKRQLLESKKSNTKVITEITQLGHRENDLKKKLDSTNKQLFKNYDMSKKDELEKERQNLKDLIKFLSKQIQDLKTQIGLFKRKGGHIYTMVTSNKKNFS